ncbi:MAG: hypothetical protein ACRD2N_12245 [Vicinamibacterales bacterium]
MKPLSVARLVIVWTTLLAVGPTLWAQGGRLQNILDSATAEFPGRAGIWAKHLATGEEAGEAEDKIGRFAQRLVDYFDANPK